MKTIAEIVKEDLEREKQLHETLTVNSSPLLKVGVFLALAGLSAKYNKGISKEDYLKMFEEILDHHKVK